MVYELQRKPSGTSESSGIPDDNSVSTAKIQDEAVTDEKLDLMPAGSVKVNNAETEGAPSNFQLGNNTFLIRLTGTFVQGTFGSGLSVSAEGVVTAPSELGTNSISTAMIQAKAATDEKLADMPAYSVKLNNTNADGAPTNFGMTASTFLVRTASTGIVGGSFGSGLNLSAEGVVTVVGTPISANGILKDSTGADINDIRNSFYDSAFTQRLRRWTAHGNNSSINATGGPALTITGTATNSATSNASVYDISGHLESLVTTPTTSAVAGWHAPTAQQCLQTGLTFFCEWAPATGVATATTRAFCGLSSATSAPTDVDPSTLTDIFGIGWDDDDTNVQFMHNDAADTCTKVDLGSNFPVPSADRTQVYRLRMYSVPGSDEVTYVLLDVNTGNTATGTISTNLPSGTTMIAPRLWMSVGGTSSVIGVAFYDMWIKSPR